MAVLSANLVTLTDLQEGRIEDTLRGCAAIIGKQAIAPKRSRVKKPNAALRPEPAWCEDAATMARVPRWAFAGLGR
jgi:hypothetical protein